MNKLRLLVLMLALFAARPAHAVRIWSSGHRLYVGLLVQPNMQVIENAAPNGRDASTEFALRRMRFIMFGNVTKNLSFFFDTDEPNWGKRANFGVPWTVLDALLSYKLVNHPWFELGIDAGFMLLPVSHHGLQSAASLIQVDYHSGVILYPAGSQFVFRDVGAEFRGSIGPGNFVYYRLGVFDGVRGTPGQMTGTPPMPVAPLNPKGLPRFAGMLRVNIFGSEMGYTTGGMQFVTKPLLSVGGGVMYQYQSARRNPTDLVTPGNVVDSTMITADVYADIPTLPDQEAVFQATYFRYMQGDGSPLTGNAFFFELGYRWKWIAPVFGYDYFKGDSSPPLVPADRRFFFGGLNYYPIKNTFNVKAEVAVGKTGNADTSGYLTTFTLQTQIFF